MAEIKMNPIISSSIPATEVKPKHDKITTGKVTVKKKSELRKLADVFIAEDIKKVRDSIIYDYVVPAVRNLIVGALSEAVRMTFQGGSPRPYNASTTFNQWTPVQPTGARYWTNPNTPTATPAYPSYGGATNSYQDVVFASRRDAENVLSEMIQTIATYGRVTISDFYDLVGVTSDYTDCAYGWTDLQTATIHAVGGGFIISLPRATALRR